jgi:hypothetical protein
MQHINPSLIARLRLPQRDYFLAILVKFHFQSCLVGGATAYTLVSLFAYPRIFYLFHIAHILNFVQR